MRKPKRRTWGTGSLTERDGRWWIRWRENGRRRSKSFASKETAEAALAKNIRDAEGDSEGLRRDYRQAPILNELAKPWLERRAKTHRDARACRCRWKLHLGPAFGRLRPHQIDAGKLRAFIEQKLTEGQSPTSVGHFVRHMSTFYADLIEQGHAPSNPVASLPRSTRRLYRSIYDTASTPFLETPEAIRRVFLAMPEPYNIMFAVGALAGLRTGEVLGLNWRDIDLEGRKIHVRQQMQEGRLCGLKDDEPRIVPLQNSLAPILTAWRLKSGGEGLIFKPADRHGGGRPDLGTAPTFVRPHTPHKYLRKALAACGLPNITWYCATRHTFASQWVLAGNPIESLSKVMGHSSVVVTERYAHLKPDLFSEKVFDAVSVDLSQPKGNVVSLPLVSAESVQLGHTMGTKQEDKTEEELAQPLRMTSSSGG
jgi:integrase